MPMADATVAQQFDQQYYSPQQVSEHWLRKSEKNENGQMILM